MRPRQEKTLIINRFDSKCGECGRGADPKESTHITEIGYAPHLPGPGCGVKWEKVTSDYTDFDGLYDNIRKMRPDLEPVWDY